MRSFSPTVTKLLFGVLTVLASLGAAGGVIFATTAQAPTVHAPAPCPAMSQEADDGGSPDVREGARPG